MSFHEKFMPEPPLETEAPKCRESDIPNIDSKSKPHWFGADEIREKIKEEGLTSKSNEANHSGIDELSEKKHAPQYLEKAADGKCYDKETGKAYDSVENWVKAQEDMAKRYEDIAQYFADEAEKALDDNDKNIKNGRPNDESGALYLRVREYCEKAKDSREKAADIWEKLNSVSDNEDGVKKPLDASATDGVDGSASETAETKSEELTDEEEEKIKEETTEQLENAQPIQNKIDGMKREKEVEEDLEEKYPKEDGYEIIPEVYLRDSDGNIVKDPETGEARRVDFVVVKDGKVVDSIEVTSKTADKTEQSNKEERIRDNGGNYIKDQDGNLCEIPADVKTRIERRD